MMHRVSILAYRTLLRTFPASTRERFEADMVQLLRDQLDDARGAGRSIMMVCLSAVWDTLVQGMAARWSTYWLERRQRRLAKAPRQDATDTRKSGGGRSFHIGGGHFFAGFGQDLPVSWRQIFRRPGFAVLAVLTLGLGIGASTTMFSVVNGVLLDPLPYPHSERLVYVRTTFPGRWYGRTTAPEFGALKRETRTLERYAAYFRSNVGILFQDRPEQVAAVGVSEDYLAVFGASPVVGRGFSEEDFRPGAARVALLSHGAWQRYWGGDPEVIGTALSTTGRADVGLPAIGTPTVIGVMPASMDERGDLWVPFRLTDAEAWGDLWRWRWQNYVLGSVGRLRPGSSLAQVQAEVSNVASRLASEHPEHYTGRSDGRSLAATSLLDREVGGYRTRILLLFAGALVVLAISVTSLTGLFLARALDRRREFAIRVALGGGRSRIFQSLMAETVSLSLLGGGVGFAIAVACLEGLQVVAPAHYPRLDNLSPDLRVVLFALAVAVVSALVCALASLPSRSGGTLDASLRQTDRTGSGRGTAGLRGLLVSAQVSLAVILLVGTGLLSASLARLRQVDPGMDVEGLLVMPVIIPGSYQTSDDQFAFFSEIVRRIEGVPGVVSASWTPDPPMYWRNISSQVGTEEMMDAEQEGLRVGIHPVGPAFLSTMGIPLLRGRGITWSEDAVGTSVAVVDELTAERLWPGQDPLGKRLGAGGEAPWYVVVGVAGRVHQLALSEDPMPEIYIPSSQHPFFPSPVGVVVRVEIRLAEVAPALRAAVWEVDRTTVIRSISSVESQISANLRDPRFFALLGSSFSLSALVLALAAIFGLMSYWVTARTREVGVRMALGARPGQVLWAVQRQSIRWVLLGLAGGLAASAAASRVFNALLFEVSPLDPSVFTAVGVGLPLAAVLATMVPALRATRVEPTAALRSE